MNYLPIYTRYISKILNESRPVFFCLTKSNLSSSSIIPCGEPLRSFSLASTFRTDDRDAIRERKIQRIIKKYPTRDRRVPIPVETSIRYLKSSAYKECYGDDPVWKLYRRNHKGGFAPRKTRKLCIRAGIVMTGNPCPICRDEYLIVDHQNLDLLKQFISETSGEIISYEITGVCQKQHDNIILAYLRAKDLGTITFDVPFRIYDYSEYTKYL